MARDATCAVALDDLNGLRVRAGLPPLAELPAPTPPGVYYCQRCDAPMAERVWACAPCRAASRGETTSTILLAARSSIPASHAHIALDSKRLTDSCHEDALRRVFGFGTPRLPSEPVGMLLTGPPGSGKTTLACALLSAYIESGIPYAATCRFVASDDAVAAHAEHGLGDGEPPLLAACIRARVLVLDDIGNERATANNPAMTALVFERARKGRVTIATTGLSSAEIVARYGAGFLRRLTDRVQVIAMRAPATAPKPRSLF